jgi:hypothetical protein
MIPIDIHLSVWTFLASLGGAALALGWLVASFERNWERNAPEAQRPPVHDLGRGRDDARRAA